MRTIYRLYHYILLCDIGVTWRPPGLGASELRMNLVAVSIIYCLIYICICICVCIYIYIYTLWHRKTTTMPVTHGAFYFVPPTETMLCMFFVRTRATWATTLEFIFLRDPEVSPTSCMSSVSAVPGL